MRGIHCGLWRLRLELDENEPMVTLTDETGDSSFYFEIEEAEMIGEGLLRLVKRLKKGGH